MNEKVFNFKLIESDYPVTVTVNCYADNGNLYVGLISAGEYDTGEHFTDLTAKGTMNDDI